MGNDKTGDTAHAASDENDGDDMNSDDSHSFVGGRFRQFAACGREDLDRERSLNASRRLADAHPGEVSFAEAAQELEYRR